MSDSLESLPDAKLSEVFYVECEGMDAETAAIAAFDSPVATSADAVLHHAPVGLRIKRTATGWATDLATDRGIFIGDDVILARAVCKTLIRAKRAQKDGA